MPIQTFGDSASILSTSQAVFQRTTQIVSRVARWDIFKPKIQILESLGMETIGIVFVHLEYLTTFWYILWQFGTFYGNLVYFPPFWYVIPRKIWQP
jgi:hypothetical protein